MVVGSQDRFGVVGLNTAMLFGLAESSFEGTFDAWVARVDERDRTKVQQAVATGIDRREPFRFDHRCTWPDGSLHWIEGIGDVIVDKNTNEVIGAFGLAIDVDERHREIEERYAVARTGVASTRTLPSTSRKSTMCWRTRSTRQRS